MMYRKIVAVRGHTNLCGQSADFITIRSRNSFIVYNGFTQAPQVRVAATRPLTYERRSVVQIWRQSQPGFTGLCL